MIIDKRIDASLEAFDDPPSSMPLGVKTDVLLIFGLKSQSHLLKVYYFIKQLEAGPLNLPQSITILVVVYSNDDKRNCG